MIKTKVHVTPQEQGGVYSVHQKEFSFAMLPCRALCSSTLKVKRRIMLFFFFHRDTTIISRDAYYSLRATAIKETTGGSESQIYILNSVCSRCIRKYLNRKVHGRKQACQGTCHARGKIGRERKRENGSEIMTVHGENFMAIFTTLRVVI